jgi:hypothetical protein
MELLLCPVLLVDALCCCWMHALSCSRTLLMAQPLNQL